MPRQGKERKRERRGLKTPLAQANRMTTPAAGKCVVFHFVMVFEMSLVLDVCESCAVILVYRRM